MTWSSPWRAAEITRRTGPEGAVTAAALAGGHLFAGRGLGGSSLRARLPQGVIAHCLQFLASCLGLRPKTVGDLSRPLVVASDASRMEEENHSKLA